MRPRLASGDDSTDCEGPTIESRVLIPAGSLGTPSCSGRLSTGEVGSTFSRWRYSWLPVMELIKPKYTPSISLVKNTAELMMYERLDLLTSSPTMNATEKNTLDETHSPMSTYGSAPRPSWAPKLVYAERIVRAEFRSMSVSSREYPPRYLPTKYSALLTGFESSSSAVPCSYSSDMAPAATSMAMNWRNMDCGAYTPMTHT